MTPPEARAEVVKALLANPPRTLHITYEGADGQVKDREVECYEIKQGRHGEVIACHCLLAEVETPENATRQFRFDRIRSIKVGRPFKPRYPIVMET